MGDRIVVMDRGAIQQAAQPLAVYQRPANLFVAGFIGTPPMNFLKGRVVRQGAGSVFRHAAGAAPLPECSARMLDLFGDQEVLLGFRPEALGGVPCGAATVRGTVDVVEPMGSETYVQVVAEDGTRLTARVGADRVFVPGAAVELPVDMANALFFDAVSGRVIGCEQTE